VVAGPSRSGIAVLVGHLPAECSSTTVVVHRSNSYGPCPASADVLTSCCWEVVTTYCQRRPAPVEEGLAEVCWSHQVAPHPFPDTLAAGHMVSAPAALLVSRASEWVAAAVAAAG
jgi:hypothetical protein